MYHIKRVSSFVFVWVITFFSLHGQLVTYDTLSRLELIRGLIADGVDIVDVRVTCDSTRQIREFNGNTSNLGLTRGLLMSTGHADSAVGPNIRSDVSTGFNRPGYVPLDSLAGQSTKDACVIEIDLIPFCDSVGIRYVFGSEEYHEFVDTTGSGVSFNDAFAFFISGPGITTPAPGRNLALVPGTNIPVSINTINNGSVPIFPRQPANEPCTNCGFFVENVLPNTTVEYDGFTVPLLATSRVVPCQLYTITLAIADGFDDFFDSGVFLEVGGISCLTNKLSLSGLNLRTTDDQRVVESCENQGEFVLTQSNPPADSVVYYLRADGSATPGVDYAPLPDSIVFLPGQDTLRVPVTIFSDAITEGNETIWWIYEDSTTCTGQTVRDTAQLLILELPSNLSPLPDTSTCAGQTLLIGQIGPSNQTYTWDVVPNLQNLNAAISIFSPPANQTIIDTTTLRLTVEVDGLCTYRDTLEVITYPDQFLRVQGDSLCLGDTLSPIALTTSLPLQSYQWVFGDGASSAVASPTHLYTGEGDFDGQLIAVDQGGCRDTAQYSVRVDPLPTLALSLDTLCQGNPMTFDANISPLNAAYWRLGDGTDTLARSFSYIYPTSGSYAVFVRASSPSGCTDSATGTAVIRPNPFAAFSVDTVCEGASNRFRVTSPNLPGQTYSWSFGDGNNSTQDDPSYTYRSPGFYPASLVVTNEWACTDTAFQTAGVLEKPLASFATGPKCLGDSTRFIDASQFNADLAYLWNFGDGTLDTGINPVYLYTFPGLYTAQQIIIGANGCSDTSVRQVQVLELPTANFQAGDACLGQATTFLNLSQVGATLGLVYEWELGDGTITDLANPSHVYPTAGTFAVSLSVEDAAGCRDSATQTVQVVDLPTADFRTDSACAGTGIQLINLSVAPAGGQIVSTFWTYPGGSATVTNPLLTFNDPGVYPVTLEVESGQGCRDTLQRDIVIFAQRIADFGAAPVCFDDTTQFFLIGNISDPSQPDFIADWSWRFGDGAETGALENPSHRYLEPGLFEVILTTTAAQGCQDEFKKIIRVYAKPEPPLGINDTTCFGQQAFLRAAIGNSSDGINWYENLTDSLPFQVGGTYDTEPILFPRTYYVEGFNDFGCISPRVPISAFVHPDQVLELVISDTLVDRPNAVVDFSVIGGIELTEFSWQFGDGSTSELPAPVHEYLFPGIYQVTLRTKDINGCGYFLSGIIEVKEFIALFIPSGFTPNGDGFNDRYRISSRLLESFTFQVFSRQGLKVFETDEPDFSWDGNTLQGGPVKEGVYTYRLVATDLNGRTIREAGTITVTR